MEARRTFLSLSFILLTFLALTVSCGRLRNRNSLRWEPHPEGNAVLRTRVRILPLPPQSRGIWDRGCNVSLALDFIFICNNYNGTYPYGIVVGLHELIHVKHSTLLGI